MVMMFRFVELISTLALFIVSTQACVDWAIYDGIDADIERISSSITDEDELSQWYGGILRLTAHDFMDFDAHSEIKYGPDGCLDWEHDSNKGLNTVWCDDCPLTILYNKKYSKVSRADFWIMSANAIIRQTSKDQSLDLRNTFYWGRVDSDSCPNSGDRVPTGTGCKEIESTLLEGMGLEWKDAVALLGAHTMGKGHEDFSGHEGYWVASTAESLTFDKKYYEELVARAWRPRNEGTKDEDYTSVSLDHPEPKMMLKTDLCLFYDIDKTYSCCTRTNILTNSGENRCDYDKDMSDKECLRYSSDHPRMAAVESVLEYLGGPSPNDNQGPFYKAFAKAWFKATMNGSNVVEPVRHTCW